jgi:hypothetical protein
VKPSSIDYENTDRAKSLIMYRKDPKHGATEHRRKRCPTTSGNY